VLVPFTLRYFYAVPDWQNGAFSAKLWQFSDLRRDPPRFILAEQLGGRSPGRSLAALL
jgi:hypothetical protein